MVVLLRRRRIRVNRVDARPSRPRGNILRGRGPRDESWVGGGPQSMLRMVVLLRRWRVRVNRVDARLNGPRGKAARALEECVV